MAMKILHADDHALFREGMRFFLKLLDSDVEIVEASNFQALVDKLALEAPIDLLLMDLAMPGMGELEGFFSIRRHPSSLQLPPKDQLASATGCTVSPSIDTRMSWLPTKKAIH